jgi:hypothetical protein
MSAEPTTPPDEPRDESQEIQEAAGPDSAQDQGSARIPLDLDELRIDALDDITTSTTLLEVPVRKPSRHNFFRVRDGVDRDGRPFYLDTLLFLLKDGDNGDETYMVMPAARSVKELRAELKPYRLFACVDRQGATFLWPARHPDSDGPGRLWHTSALKVAERAKVAWVRMVGNKSAGCYELNEAMGQLGEPDWPDISMAEMVDMAYGERVIDSPDHPVVKRLQGRI